MRSVFRVAGPSHRCLTRDKALWEEAEEEALLAEYALYEEALHGGPRRREMGIRVENLHS